MSDLHALNLQHGDIVGGYTLDARLGAGAMGSVWRVTDGGGTSYAMKILRDSLNDEAADEAGRRAQTTARERLRREAMALKRIKDPGVCSIADMELDDSLAFIVTELIEGDNLRQDVAQNGRYMGSDLERLAEKLIAAVHAVHAAGIVHRDIKPTNVMVSVTGPILVDFGIAMGEGESHVTSTGLVMGTPGFIAPEIIEGQEATEATDWWSTASVLAFAATGAPVFGTQPMLAVLQREATGNANLQGLPPRTLQAFRAALSPHPEERCTPDELLDAISADAWEAESHLPFEAAAPATGAAFRRNESVNNPRTLWRAQSMPTASILFPAGRPRAAAQPEDGSQSDDGMRTHNGMPLDPPRPPTATRPIEASTTPLRQT
ncbi:MAG: serine/threonine protein kinase, partial [Bifidobacterium castoris]|nr:serine/threonine protein kinase [Bifidobacterium castoris]